MRLQSSLCESFLNPYYQSYALLYYTVCVYDQHLYNQLAIEAGIKIH